MMGIPTVKNNKTNYSTIKHSEIMGSNHCCENTAASFVATVNENPFLGGEKPSKQR